MTGGVLLRQGDKLAGADRARYDPASKALLLDGNVRYEDTNSHVESASAEFAYGAGRIRFEGASFTLDGNAARGEAVALEINQEGKLELDGVSYTTCPPESNDWIIEAKDIDLDTRNGVGTAKGVKLRFQGVPILYSPYFSFPIGDARKSGVLSPQFGTGGRSGNEIRLPYLLEYRAKLRRDDNAPASNRSRYADCRSISLPDTNDRRQRSGRIPVKRQHVQ